MKKILSKQQEKKLLENIHNDAVNDVINDYAQFNNIHESHLFELNRISPVFNLLKKKFLNGLDNSYLLSKNGLERSNFNKKRISYSNTEMANYLKDLNKYFAQAGKIWVLDGLVFDNQVAGMKSLTGFEGKEGLVIDVLNSAASLSLGAENPWLVKMDYVEDILGIRDNFCAAYHPGKKQAYSLKKFAENYPNKNVKNLAVHSESSGSIVNSIAIESVIAYVEKKFGNNVERKILAVDGTWAGGYGSAREGTGFGVGNQQDRKLGKSLWIERCLPAPTKENSEIFLKVLKEKLLREQVAGLYLEPDVIGDLGLLLVDQNLLVEVKKIMLKHKLPIIFDCVQQLGRSGSYWGENVDTVFTDYPYLVLTTAKSASNGQPFGYVVMPKEISDSAYPLSQITTNQMNSSQLRAIVVGKILQNKELQKWLKRKSDDLEEVAVRYGFKIGPSGLRGKFLNRGIYLENNELVKLAQISLLVEDGILVGATPHSVRYQPMLLEYSQTNRQMAELIFRRLKYVKEGKIHPIVLEIFNKMSGTVTGLARDTK
jgi:4-aminobutyrate aminotransferase-like enzyme